MKEDSHVYKQRNTELRVSKVLSCAVRLSANHLLSAGFSNAGNQLGVALHYREQVSKVLLSAFCSPGYKSRSAGPAHSISAAKQGCKSTVSSGATSR